MAVAEGWDLFGEGEEGSPDYWEKSPDFWQRSPDSWWTSDSWERGQLVHLKPEDSLGGAVCQLCLGHPAVVMVLDGWGPV